MKRKGTNSRVLWSSRLWSSIKSQLSQCISHLKGTDLKVPRVTLLRTTVRGLESESGPKTTTIRRASALQIELTMSHWSLMQGEYVRLINQISISEVSTASQYLVRRETINLLNRISTCNSRHKLKPILLQFDPDSFLASKATQSRITTVHPRTSKTRDSSTPRLMMQMCTKTKTQASLCPSKMLKARARADSCILRNRDASRLKKWASRRSHSSQAWKKSPTNANSVSSCRENPASSKEASLRRAVLEDHRAWIASTKSRSTLKMVGLSSGRGEQQRPRSSKTSRYQWMQT